MRQLSFAAIEKRLAKKNSELQEVRTMRKRLAEREKEISADIETLQNQKVEIIFLQVKREMKNEKLDVSSGSVLPLLEALRNTQQMMSDKNSAEEDTPKSDDLTNGVEEKTELNLRDKVDSLNKIAGAERTGNEGR